MLNIPLLTDFTPLSALIRILLAALLGAAVGLERGRHGRAAGLRTHVLVCVGSALSSLTGIFLIEKYGIGDPSRIAASVVSGIGFLGAGMIIVKRDTKVTGLTTAAALWATSTVGLAAVNATLDELKARLPQSHDAELTAAKSGMAGHIGLHFTVNTANVSAAEVLAAVRPLPAVVLAVEE